MQQLEIEVKFYTAKLAKLRAEILQLGAKSLGRHYENNLRFENAEKHLQNRSAMLRLRQTGGQNIVTVKQRVAHPAASTCKVFQEYETEVGDFDTIVEIFGILGYSSYQVYEKYRETLTTPAAKFCLDETPYGNFVEIEADEDMIRRCAKLLNLNWGHRIVLSYLDIFYMLKENAQLPFETLTFDNFNKLSPKINVESILPELYAA